MKFDKLTRRHFLNGICGQSLSLPFLSSLWSKELLAAEPVNDKCIFLIWSPHGGVKSQFLLPPALQSPTGPYPTLTEEVLLAAYTAGGNIAPEHKIRSQSLTSFLFTDPVTGLPQFSHIVGPKLSAFLSKMIVARGIDIPSCHNGHINGSWGNFRASTNAFEKYHTFMSRTATIDQVLANSSSFYSTFQLNNSTRQRVLVYGESPYDILGNAISGGTISTSDLYRNVFGSQVQNQGTKTLMIDQVLTDYNRLMSPASDIGSKLSANDRAILDHFGTQLFEVQRRLNSITACPAVAPSSPQYLNSPQYNGKAVTYVNWDEIYDAFADAVALSFSCGSTRIFYTAPNIDLLGDADYHGNVAHALSNPGQAQIHANNMRYISEEFVAVLAQKLNSIATTDGKTILDKSSIIWTHESGIEETHDTSDLPMIVIGGLDGKLSQNRFVDFRNLDNLSMKKSSRPNIRPGVLMNQVLANILQAAGLNRSEFEKSCLSSNGIIMPGYGDTFIASGVGSERNYNGHVAYTPAMVNQMSSPLKRFGNFS
ncbi:MAG: DUF1552 domain-containing protein [Proteobacteria bacterium]|nr:DUF1552 domain-containing protein [Pseudomonadota bacterium]